MPKITAPFTDCNRLVSDFEKVIKKPIVGTSSVYYTGVDLGTAYVVLAVLDEQYKPVAGAIRFADVVRDGMVVDFIGATQIVRELKAEIEEKLGTELLYASAAIPPGTEAVDAGAIKYVVEGAGFELTCLLDEPTAANAVLKITDGAIVDIGGGTTGISIFKDGKVVKVVDEPTGGTHFSLVVAGAYKISFEKAEKFKQAKKNHKELLPVLTPVIEKVATIINANVSKDEVNAIYLVGGTCCFTGIEEMIQQYTGIPTYKPKNPMCVTPLGIALNCTQQIL